MDRQRFDGLMLAHLAAAERLAVRLTGSLEAAEDLVQEAMVRASRAWRSYRGEARFTTWLFQILINAFRDRLRQRRLPAATLDDAMEQGTGPSPSAELEGEELGVLVARHVSALPPRQREVLVLVAFEGMPPRQAAEVLGISEPNARTNLHLARQMLKRQLAGYLGDEEPCEPRHRPI